MKLKLKFNFQPVPMIMTLVQLYFILLQYCSADSGLNLNVSNIGTYDKSSFSLAYFLFAQRVFSHLFLMSCLTEQLTLVN